MRSKAERTACNGWEKHRDLAAFQDDVKSAIICIGLTYPNKRYGMQFRRWLHSENPHPYMSYGKGSAMRVSPCAWFARSLDEAEALGAASANATKRNRASRLVSGTASVSSFAPATNTEKIPERLI